MAWALKQAGDDAELDCGQRNRPAVKGHLAAIWIEQQQAVTDRFRLFLLLRRLSRRAAKDDVDPRHQLARTERLGDIVVAAHFQSQNTVDFLVAGRQEEDRHR